MQWFISDGIAADLAGFSSRKMAGQMSRGVLKIGTGLDQGSGVSENKYAERMV